jgi:hypothetical protein
MEKIVRHNTGWLTGVILLSVLTALCVTHDLAKVVALCGFMSVCRSLNLRCGIKLLFEYFLN